MASEPFVYGGFAPGSYLCCCAICQATFQGDKRAYWCEPCAREKQVIAMAFAAASPAPAPEPAPQAAGLRRDHLIVAANLIKDRIRGADTPFEVEAIERVEAWLRALSAEREWGLREQIARYLTKQAGKDPDFVVHYESNGFRCEPPKDGPSPWETTPAWEWFSARQADDILAIVGRRPTIDRAMPPSPSATALSADPKERP